MKLTWGDVSGGATPRNPSSAGAGIPGPGIEAEPTSLVSRANTWLDEILELIRKIDQAVGVFLQIQGKVPQNEGGPAEIRGATTPEQTAPTPDALLVLLELIIATEGDIPLSRFVEAIRNQETWLLNMVAGAAEQQSQSEGRTA